jgi:hypothetical protein
MLLLLGTASGVILGTAKLRTRTEAGAIPKVKE